MGKPPFAPHSAHFNANRATVVGYVHAITQRAGQTQFALSVFVHPGDIGLRLQFGYVGQAKIPGAALTEFKVWQIPSTQVARFMKPENRPKAGWKKGRPRKEAASKKAKGAGK